MREAGAIPTRPPTQTVSKPAGADGADAPEAAGPAQADQAEAGEAEAGGAEVGGDGPASARRSQLGLLAASRPALAPLGLVPSRSAAAGPKAAATAPHRMPDGAPEQAGRVDAPQAAPQGAPPPDADSRGQSQATGDAAYLSGFGPYDAPARERPASGARADQSGGGPLAAAGAGDAAPAGPSPASPEKVGLGPSGQELAGQDPTSLDLASGTANLGSAAQSSQPLSHPEPGGPAQPVATPPTATAGASLIWTTGHPADAQGFASGTAPSAPSAVGQLTPVFASLASAAPGMPNSLVIRLDPAELGRVQVRVDRTADGPAHVMLAVERSETLALFMHSQTQLHQALDAAGLAADGRTVQFSLSSGGQGFGDGRGAQGRAGHGQENQGGAGPGRSEPGRSEPGPGTRTATHALPSTPRRLASCRR